MVTCGNQLAWHNLVHKVNQNIQAMNKKLLALVGGAGVAAGVLLAPDKGSRTISKLAGKGKKLVNGVKKSATGEISSAKKRIQSKVDDVKKAIHARAKAVVNASLQAEEKMHKKVSGAIRTAGKAVGVEKKKIVSRNGAAKKMVKAKASGVKKALRKKTKSAGKGTTGKSARASG